MKPENRDMQDAMDDTLDDTFPASDPPSWSSPQNGKYPKELLKRAKDETKCRSGMPPQHFSRKDYMFNRGTTESRHR